MNKVVLTIHNSFGSSKEEEELLATIIEDSYKEDIGYATALMYQ